MGEEKEWLDAIAIFESTLAKHNKPVSGLSFGSPEMKATLSKGRSILFTSADMLGLMSALGELQQSRAEHPAKDHSKVFKQV